MRDRDESGAVAIIVAMMALGLLSMAALTLDLGMAFVQKQDVQLDSDLAALAGAANDNLPGTTVGTCAYGPRASASDQAVIDVAHHFEAESWSPLPTASGLVDCDATNGEVLYGTVVRPPNSSGFSLTHDEYQLTVLSPQRQVDFGFAQVMGFDDVDVVGNSTVAVESPAVDSVPLYAFTGCDYGRQTIAQPNNGHSIDTPRLSHGEEENEATLTALVTQPATTPPMIPAGDPAPGTGQFDVAGSGLGDVGAVGFFESGGSSPGPEPVVVAAGDFVSKDGSGITLATVPSAVRNVPGAWFVRVKIADQWSQAVDNSGNLAALPLLVGEPTLTCGQGSSEGNFGSLDLPNGQSGRWQQIALNIAAGLERTLAIHPSPQDPWTCSGDQSGAVLWDQGLEGTNCVDTKPGMVASAAQAGFIDGIGGTPGRLANVAAGTGCSGSGDPTTATVSGVTINNDTLTCFLTDSTINLGTISGANYAGGPVLSPAIFASPRFLMVPVLGRQPTQGGSSGYQIVGLRPGFITDQPNSATRSSPASPGNGLTLNKKGDEIESVQIVFLNAAALPAMDAASTTPYGGSGPRVLRLID